MIQVRGDDEVQTKTVAVRIGSRGWIKDRGGTLRSWKESIGFPGFLLARLQFDNWTFPLVLIMSA